MAVKKRTSHLTIVITDIGTTEKKVVKGVDSGNAVIK
jgi:hypothetical protein